VHVAALLLAMTTTAATLGPPPTRVIQWASPTQKLAFEYGPHPLCLSGGWGSGKTYVASLKAICLSTQYRRNRGVIARFVGKELRETTMATFYKLVPPHLYDRSLGGRRNDQNGYLKFADSESEVLFIHLDDPETAGILRGLEINWFVIDQAEENPDHMEELFDLLMGRLGRWDVADVPPELLARYERDHRQPWPYVHAEKGTPIPPSYPIICCNPDVETHWIYRRFHPESPEYQSKYKALRYTMLEMPSTENQFLGDINLTYLLQHDDAFVRRNVKGLWGLPEGAIHTIDRLSEVEGSQELLAYFRSACLLYRSMDHGDSAPTCCLWWAVDKDGNCFCMREYYAPNQLISTHRANITALSEHERYENDLADPAIFNPTMQNLKRGRYSVADEYADVVDQPRSTALFWNPADNNELGTRNKINEYLRVDPDRIHPITKQRGSPRLFFVKVNSGYPQGCFHVLRELRAQRRVKIGTDLGRPMFSDERDPSIPDHAVDPVRYFLASRPSLPRPTTLAPDGSFDQQRRLARRQREQFGAVR
jgi:hypothetical protein